MPQQNNTPDATRKELKPRRKLDEVSLLHIKRRWEDYFYEQDSRQKPYTLAGLATTLNVTSETLKSYANVNEEFRELYELVRTHVEENILERMQGGKTHPVSGIFILKAAFKYQDNTNVSAEENYIFASVPSKVIVQKKAGKISSADTPEIESL